MGIVGLIVEEIGDEVADEGKGLLAEDTGWVTLVVCELCEIDELDVGVETDGIGGVSTLEPDVCGGESTPFVGTFVLDTLRVSDVEVDILGICDVVIG